MYSLLCSIYISSPILFQGKWSHHLLASINCNFRITSMAVYMKELNQPAEQDEEIIDEMEDNEEEDSDVDEESKDTAKKVKLHPKGNENIIV